MWLLLLFFLSATEANKFGADFEAITHNTTEYTAFAYADRTECYVHQELRHGLIFLHTRNIDTFEATYPIVHNMTKPLVVDGCFHHEGRAYLWMHDPHLRRVVIVRGSDVLVSKTRARYDIGRYDYTDGSAYLCTGRQLKRYRFADLLDVWMNKNHSGQLPTSEQNLTLPSFFKDFQVVKQRVFFTSDNAILKLEEDNRWDVVTILPHLDVQFVLFQRSAPQDSAGGIRWDISATVPSFAFYALELGLLIFLVYCMRYKLTLRAGGSGNINGVTSGGGASGHAIELTPPTIAK